MEYHNPTLRVLRILELIDANSGGLSLSEIANLSGPAKGHHFPHSENTGRHQLRCDGRQSLQDRSPYL
ncbi:MAG: hypothetical protein ACLUS6_14225 [Dysosmobacter sp.]